VVLVGDVGQVERRFGSHGDGVNLGEIGARFAQNVPQACNSFWPYPMVLLGYVVKCKLVSIHLEIVLISIQDSCMVCTEHPIGLEIVLGTPDGTPR
jgi:hypothetical protein